MYRCCVDVRHTLGHDMRCLITSHNRECSSAKFESSTGSSADLRCEAEKKASSLSSRRPRMGVGGSYGLSTSTIPTPSVLY